MFFGLGLFGFFYFVLSWVFATKGSSDKIYRNLHPVTYPITTSDLTLLEIVTPAMPIRLSSAWEIQTALSMPIDSLKSTYSMIYPMIENNNDMHIILLEQANMTGNRNCPACDAQKIWALKNTVKDSQKYKTCPRRDETKDSWMKRTGQSENQNTDNYFYYNSEHAEECRKTKLSSMALAHVSKTSFSLFSSQYGSSLLLFLVTVNALFMASIAIYLGWDVHLPNTVDRARQLKTAGHLSSLFLVVTAIVLIPTLVDYVTNFSHKSSYKNNLGSSFIGIWTILLSFLFVCIMPKMHITLEGQDANVENGSDSSRATKDRQIIQYFVSHQPMISMAYWHFMQAPCVVLFVLSTVSYGIDLYMQFIFFGTLAIGVLDIIHTRVNIIIGLSKRVIGDKATIRDRPKYLDFAVTSLFIAMNLILSIPVLYKMQEAGVTMWGLVAVIATFHSQIFFRIFSLIFRFLRYCGQKTDLQEEKTSNKDSREVDPQRNQAGVDSANQGQSGEGQDSEKSRLLMEAEMKREKIIFPLSLNFFYHILISFGIFLALWIPTF